MQHAHHTRRGYLRSATFRRCVFTFVILSVILTKDANASCTDGIARGSLNILTINLLFSEYETLNDRLTSIAQFIADQYVASAPTTVDVLLLQEVVGGALADKRAERLGRTNI